MHRAGTAQINACGDSRLRGLRSRKPIGFRQWVVHLVRLAWVKGNPQSECFWLKNKFTIIKETTSTVCNSVILAERKL